MQEKHFYGLDSHGFQCIAYNERGKASAQSAVTCVHGLARNGRDFDYLARAFESDAETSSAPTLPAAARATGSPILPITITHNILAT